MGGEQNVYSTSGIQIQCIESYWFKKWKWTLTMVRHLTVKEQKNKTFCETGSDTDGTH